MSGFKTHDPAKNSLIVNGIPIEGYADEMITVEGGEDTWTKTTGCDDQTTRVKHNATDGSIHVFLQQTSPSNDYLTGLYNIDKASSQGTFPVMFKDQLGTTMASSGKAWIRALPQFGRGKDLKTIEWVIDCAQLNRFIGGGI